LFDHAKDLLVEAKAGKIASGKNRFWKSQARFAALLNPGYPVSFGCVPVNTKVFRYSGLPCRKGSSAGNWPHAKRLHGLTAADEDSAASEPIEVRVPKRENLFGERFHDAN
jgi:hypothetical protein